MVNLQFLKFLGVNLQCLKVLMRKCDFLKIGGSLQFSKFRRLNIKGGALWIFCFSLSLFIYSTLKIKKVNEVIREEPKT